MPVLATCPHKGVLPICSQQIFFWAGRLLLWSWFLQREELNNPLKKTWFFDNMILPLPPSPNFCNQCQYCLLQITKSAIITLRWITFNMAWRSPFVVFFVLIFKNTTERNDNGAFEPTAMRWHYHHSLHLPLKNYNQPTMATDRGLEDKGWAREVRGKGENGGGGRSATKLVPSTKPVGDVVGLSMTTAPSPLSLSSSLPIQCLWGGNIKDNLQLGGEPHHWGTGRVRGVGGTAQWCRQGW